MQIKPFMPYNGPAPIGQKPVPGGLIGSAGVEPAGSTFRTHDGPPDDAGFPIAGILLFTVLGVPVAIAWAMGLKILMVDINRLVQLPEVW